MTQSTVSDPAFFVVGFSRSGTTLFSSLLSRHSNVTIPPETRFCHGVLPSGRADFRVHAHRTIERRVFAYWRMPDLDVDRADFAALFSAQAGTYASAFACLLECFREQTGKALVGEKSPVHLLYVDTLLKWFEEARIFVLIRDGRDVVESMVNAPFTHGNRMRHAAEWSYQSALARRAAEDNPHRVRIVLFEDLVARPSDVLASVCADLGIQFEAAQVQPAEKSPVVPEWEKDWKGQALESVDEEKVALWKKKPQQSFSDSVCWYIMRAEVERWGYEMPKDDVGGGIAAWLVSGLYRGSVYRIARRVSLETKTLLHRIGLRKHL